MILLMQFRIYFLYLYSFESLFLIRVASDIYNSNGYSLRKRGSEEILENHSKVVHDFDLNEIYVPEKQLTEPIDQSSTIGVKKLITSDWPRRKRSERKRLQSVTIDRHSINSLNRLLKTSPIRSNSVNNKRKRKYKYIPRKSDWQYSEKLNSIRQRERIKNLRENDEKKFKIHLENKRKCYLKLAKKETNEQKRKKFKQQIKRKSELRKRVREGIATEQDYERVKIIQERDRKYQSKRRRGQL